jgi:hypothetical protein
MAGHIVLVPTCLDDDRRDRGRGQDGFSYSFLVERAFLGGRP